MPEFNWRTHCTVSAEQLFAWHTRPGALERLLPPWDKIQVPRREGPGVQDGARVELRIPLGPLRLRWLAGYSGFQPGRQFVTEQLRGPFAHWVHTHRFQAGAPGPDGRPTADLADRVEYALPGGALGELLGGALLRRRLRRVFTYRERRLREDLERHQRHAGAGRWAVSGSSGLIGRRLVAFLASGGHSVQRLVRAPAQAGEIHWNPAAGTVDRAALEGLDGVVHLAGESLSGGRWSARRRAAILDSRTGGTRLLCEALAGLARPPRVLVSASAIGFYGARGETPVTERDAPGRGFLAEVCQAWEQATAPARDAGIRVVNLRIGMVLAAEGGALAPLAKVFALGLGGPVGDGRQGMSWIALEDLIGVIHQALHDERLRGPVNAVAPTPVSNREFARTLGRVLRRPAGLPLPAPAVRLALGAMGQELLLEGAYVLPDRLRSLDFPFLYPTLESALRAELGA